jgi:hypothetical protein
MRIPTTGKRNKSIYNHKKTKDPKEKTIRLGRTISDL